MEHFTFEELKQIKATVLQQHFRVELDEEKLVTDSKSGKFPVSIGGLADADDNDNSVADYFRKYRRKRRNCSK